MGAEPPDRRAGPGSGDGEASRELEEAAGGARPGRRRGTSCDSEVARAPGHPGPRTNRIRIGGRGAPSPPTAADQEERGSPGRSLRGLVTPGRWTREPATVLTPFLREGPRGGPELPARLLWVGHLLRGFGAAYRHGSHGPQDPGSHTHRHPGREVRLRMVGHPLLDLLVTAADARRPTATARPRHAHGPARPQALGAEETRRGQLLRRLHGRRPRALRGRGHRDPIHTGEPGAGGR